MAGHITKKSGYWVLRHRVRVIENGQVRSVLRAKRLGLIADFPPKRHRGKDGKDVPNEILQMGSEICTEGVEARTLLTRFGEFVEQVYLPFVSAQRKPSTHKDYVDIWNVHLKARAANVWLRDIQTADVQGWLNDIESQARTPAGLKLAHTSLARIKSFLSGAFKHALQAGMMTGVNPATSASVPRGRASKETHAYELSVAQQIIAVLKEPESTIVAVAAYSGLRLGEILGLTWENYSGATLNVTQNAYRGTLVTPKTRASQDDVPVIPALRSKLDLWRLRCGNPTSGLMFPNETGAPLDPSNLDRGIRRELQKAGLPWFRFHAFRRGVATNLHDAGVNDLTIQRVLRHSDPSTTRRSYIKRLPQQATDAMAKMQAQIDAATGAVQVQ
jgi:integrase